MEMYMTEIAGKRFSSNETDKKGMTERHAFFIEQILF